jgi:pimeloyl-ACP methyl ester carboxylesterase
MPELDSNQWRTGGETIEFRGYRLFSRSSGQGGRPLLLIHGFPTSSFDWVRLWSELIGQHQVHVIDMLGFGWSDKPRDFAYSVAASADQWQALAQAKGLRDVDVLAHDYGNTVAQELLARQLEGLLPFQIRSVAFLNGGLFPEATYPLMLQKLLLGPFGPIVARLTSYRGFARSMRRICAQAPGDNHLQEHWRLLARADGRRVLSKLIGYIRERREFRERWVGALLQAGIPLCLIDGVADPISGASIIRRWQELLPNAMAVELDDVGHYPQWEAPARVLTAFRTFSAGEKYQAAAVAVDGISQNNP